jgi:hypothetical protein
VARKLLFLALRLLWASAFAAYGLLSARMVSPTQVFQQCNQPTQLLYVPDVKRPVFFGLLSGLSLGAYPRQGFGAPTACLDVDAGRGIAPAQWPLMVRASAKVWALSRAAGFWVLSLVLWWAGRWLWLAARLLQSPKSSTLTAARSAT